LSTKGTSEEVTATKHPSYEKPTIAEALCEIRFRTADEERWEPTWFAAFHDRIRPEFPSWEPQALLNVHTRVSGEGVEQRIPRPVTRLRSTRPDRPQLVQLTPWTLTVNELEPYPGWDTFLADIRWAWEHLAAVVEPSAVARIGLRYINGLPRRDPEEPVSEWLAESPWWPDAVRERTSSFFSRLQVRLDERDRLNVTVGEAPPERRLHRVALDIDAIVEADLPASWDSLTAEIERLHARASEVFDAAMTPKLLACLKGESL